MLLMLWRNNSLFALLYSLIFLNVFIHSSVLCLTCNISINLALDVFIYSGVLCLINSVNINLTLLFGCI